MSGPWKWLLVLLPAVLGITILIFLVQGDVISFTISLRRDLDVIILLSGAALSLLFAAILAVRESMTRLNRQSLNRARGEAVAERQRFLRHLNHEMKNPLTAIRAALVNLAGTDDPDARQEIRTTIEAQTVRLSHLVASLRKLVDLESMPLEQATIDVADLLQEVIALAQERPETATQSVKLSLRFPSPPFPTIVGDHDLLLLALVNLLDNALKFGRPDTQITLRAYTNDAEVVIEVVDTGPGIAAADLPYVWEELYRGQATYDVPGSGIGLTLVRAIVERHGGQATLTSQENVGTTVTLRFPNEAISTS